MRRALKVLLVLLVALVIAGLLFLRTFSAAPLPAPAALTDPLPSASPPADMTLVAIATGVIHRDAATAYRGGSFSDKREFSMGAVLVKHPKGDLLIDSGLGRDVDHQVALMPFYIRALTTYHKDRPAADQLDAVGYDRKRLRGILLTHAHWDHVSGIADFPGTPVLVDAAERRFIDGGSWIAEVAHSLPDVKYEEYTFEGGSYLGFPAHHDIFGDGSVVVVPTGGHTPGSVIVFVTLPGDHRAAFVGDLCWQREGITEREERPWLPRKLADADEEGVRTNLLRMAAIHARFPDIALLPAHDARAFAALPQL